LLRRIILSGVVICRLFLFTWEASAAVLLDEPFEDADFAARGWYDAPSGTISSAEHIPGSTASFECHIPLAANGCRGGNPARHAFAESESVYITYWVKHTLNTTGSHLFYLLTNVDGPYNGLAYTHLTVYIEQNAGHPQIRIQDGANIDEARVGTNLVQVTEKRALAGCNGNSDTVNHYVAGPYGDGDCWLEGSVHWNGRNYRQEGEPVYFSPNPGPFYAGDWHHIEAFIKMNAVSNGIGLPNGEVRMSFDGKLIFQYNDVVLRTGARPNAKFNQFIIGSWVGGGSPVDQTYWIDNLKVMTAPPFADRN
jgi:hypothetical protein